MRTEQRNLDGQGNRPTKIYDMAPAPEVAPGYRDYWQAVTDVPCPVCEDGTVCWAEAGHVPGYRICDGCGRHFLAEGTAEQPALAQMRGRRS